MQSAEQDLEAAVELCRLLRGSVRCLTEATTDFYVMLSKRAYPAQLAKWRELQERSWVYDRDPIKWSA